MYQTHTISPLLTAVFGHDLGHLRDLINGGTYRDEYPHALEAAVADEHQEDTVKALLEVVEAPSKKALCIAVIQSYPGMVRLLLGNISNSTDVTWALRRATNAVRPNPEIIELLLQHGAKPHGVKVGQVVSNDSVDLLDWAAEKGELNIVQLLLKNNVKPTSNALISAVRNDNIPITRAILKADFPDLQTISNQLQWGLHFKKNSELMMVLLDADASPAINTVSGITNLLMSAAISYNPAMVHRVILTYGGELNQEHFGAALLEAVKCRDLAIVNTLLNVGAKPSSEALACAINHNYNEIVNVLDNQPQSLAMLASINIHQQLVTRVNDKVWLVSRAIQSLPLPLPELLVTYISQEKNPQDLYNKTDKIELPSLKELARTIIRGRVVKVATHPQNKLRQVSKGIKSMALPDITANALLKNFGVAPSYPVSSQLAPCRI